MKKSLFIVTISIAIAFTLSGCSGFTGSSGSSNNSEDSGQITLKFMHRWPKEPEKSFFEDVVKEFEKKNPKINIETQAVLNNAYKQKIKVLLGSNDQPDIFFAWSGEYAHNIVRSNKALDLTSYYKKDQNWSGQLVQSAVEPYNFNKKMYGVPWDLDAKLFFYNKDIFNQLNLNPPKTFDQLLKVSKELKSNGYIPIAEGDKDKWPAGHYIGTLNRRVVPDNVIEEDRIRSQGTFENPLYVEALRKLNKINKVAFNENINAYKHDKARKFFSNGKAAMAFLEILEIGLYQPNADFESGTFNFPAIEDGNDKGNPSIISGAPEGFMISSKTEHPDAAMKFLKFLTNKSNGKKLVNDLGYFSAVKGTLTKDNSTPLMRNAYETLMGAKHLAPWIDTGLDIKVANTYLSDIQTMFNGEMTSQQVMKDVQEAATKVRNEAKSN
ncbi:ABC transporter substrate-binding protein [Tuberibacillus sp. Marseille-P3662]|uniref:ABC transporter substrate-binding protein n=1 Tax=Tuberibacillus sp. Marseille-P3662 TaxID=1965358 RepID=UPI000A1CA33E|nr:extracellular solute-binding protein [Tuberibacillus sp. Marseille-P3662]